MKLYFTQLTHQTSIRLTTVSTLVIDAKPIQAYFSPTFFNVPYNHTTIVNGSPQQFLQFTITPILHSKTQSPFPSSPLRPFVYTHQSPSLSSYIREPLLFNSFLYLHRYHILQPPLIFLKPK